MSYITIKATKTKLAKLLRDKGYNPNLKLCRFTKLSRRRSYWLHWWDPSEGEFVAYLSIAAGKAFVRITHNNADTHINISREELEKYDMKEEIKK